MKIYNFSAGPAKLPEEVMEKANSEFLNYGGSGSGLMELSHRGPEFTDIIERVESNIRKLMNISDDYAVCFVQGGASMQFCMLPMNLMEVGGFAEYADTGTWAAKAIKEAKLFGDVKVIASSKDSNYNMIPLIRHWSPDPSASYLHITSNNTVAGTQYHAFPITEAPLIADMSSDIMSRVIDVNEFGMIYAGAQKNLGPSGVALVIIRKDLAERVSSTVPSMLQYKSYIANQSMYNTPPTFSIYILNLVMEWLEGKGGISSISAINDAKSEAIYELIDRTEYYSSPIEPSNRSKMNIVFRLPSEKLEAKFIKDAKVAGLVGLKGHRLVGGIRASIYNAMPMKGIEALVDFMNDFESKNG